MGGALHLNKLESPSPRDTLCQVWLKLAQWFLRRRFLKVVNLFLLIPNYLPFGKGVALRLNKLEFPSPKDTLCQVWLKLAQWFWRRRWKCEKFTDRQTDGQTNGQTTDDRWSEKLTWAFSSGELKSLSHSHIVYNLKFFVHLKVESWFMNTRNRLSAWCCLCIHILCIMSQDYNINNAS